MEPAGDGIVHSCLKKCGGGVPPCEGEDCHCEGYLPFGRPDKFVLCEPRPVCEELCRQTEGCVAEDC